VDLDGTLIAADLFWEALLRLLRTKPYLLLLLPFWGMRGRAYLKRQVAVRAGVDAAALPYRPEVLQHLEKLRAAGYSLVLATGSDELYAHEITRYLGIFSDTVASDGTKNLSGRRKARVLSERFGVGNFHYVGNDRSDLHVWMASRGATIVAASNRVVRRVARNGSSPNVLVPGTRVIHAIARALRPHQWSKNLLILVPLFFAHQLLNVPLLLAALTACIAFSLCASSIYVLNDLFDLEADRLHARKRKRPFAAGELSIPFGIALAALLMTAGISLAGLAVSWTLVGTLVCYAGITTAYTAWLKREPVVDVFVLAGLYVLRLVAGGVAADLELSTWLLGFALFFFLSLAFVKRYTELVGNGRTPGRGYAAEDALWMHAVGTSSGYMAIVVLALYVTAPDVAALYSHPKVLWLLCPVLLFWITRMWFRAGRRLLHDDPVVEALKDPVGYLCAAATALVLMSAL
jgi:4-hydroxybenzoate polyprenyltransferase/phosphoserine phosphatase